MCCTDELADVSFAQAFSLLMDLFVGHAVEYLTISEQVISVFVDKFLETIPDSMPTLRYIYICYMIYYTPYRYKCQSSGKKALSPVSERQGFFYIGLFLNFLHQCHAVLKAELIGSSHLASNRGTLYIAEIAERSQLFFGQRILKFLAEFLPLICGARNFYCI